MIMTILLACAVENPVMFPTFETLPQFWVKLQGNWHQLCSGECFSPHAGTPYVVSVRSITVCVCSWGPLPLHLHKLGLNFWCRKILKLLIWPPNCSKWSAGIQRRNDRINLRSWQVEKVSPWQSASANGTPRVSPHCLKHGETKSVMIHDRLSVCQHVWWVQSQIALWPLATLNAGPSCGSSCRTQPDWFPFAESKLAIGRLCSTCLLFFSAPSNGLTKAMCINLTAIYSNSPGLQTNMGHHELRSSVSRSLSPVVVASNLLEE